MATTMDPLEQKIQAALTSATDLPDNLLEPRLTDELIATFNGRHSWLMKWGLFKMAVAITLLCFCVFQFFQQDTTMGMLAYASGAVIATLAYGFVVIFIWMEMNQNTTVREVKRLELQVAMLTRALNQQQQDLT